MGEEQDLPPGRRLVAYFMPFLLHLAGSGLSKRTIRNHVDNIWLLGREIIRDVNQDPPLRKVAAEQLVRNVIHEDGGPLIHNGWEDEQRSFDSTCRKFQAFRRTFATWMQRTGATVKNVQGAMRHSSPDQTLKVTCGRSRLVCARRWMRWTGCSRSMVAWQKKSRRGQSNEILLHNCT